MTGFPPGEIGTRFDQICDLAVGDFVYVRMQIWRAEPSDRDSFACKLLMPIGSASYAAAFQLLWVARSQIVCREPKVMEADEGVVRSVLDR
jgi:hypothetical protein